MLHVMTTGAYDLLVVTTGKILTTGASFLTTGTLCVEELGYKGGVPPQDALTATKEVKLVKPFQGKYMENVTMERKKGEGIG